MRVLLVGCGGVGGVVAAALSRAGVALDIVTGNQSISSAIAERGLRVRELDGKEWSVAPQRPAVVKLAELYGLAKALPSEHAQGYDLCLFATKTTILDSVLAEVAPILSPDGAVVLLQNGLPEERAEAVVGEERVIGCVVGWGATLLEPGLSARTSRGGMQLGRRLLGASATTDRRLQDALELFGRAFETRRCDNLDGVRWSKLAINCATSTLGAAGGHTLGRMLRQRFVRRLALEIWAELCAVARAHGVRMAKVAGTLDIERLAITEAERQKKVGSPGLFLKHSLLFGLGLKFRRMRSSMAVAIERGRRPEIDYLNGEVARRGELLGIATPVNRALVRLIHDIVATEKQPGLNTLYELYLHHCAPQQPPQPRLPPVPPSQRGGAGRSPLSELAVDPRR
jgi:2-dehydropantoate 2-reductase